MIFYEILGRNNRLVFGCNPEHMIEIYNNIT